jgi:hypothetical protein
MQFKLKKKGDNKGLMTKRIKSNNCIFNNKLKSKQQLKINKNKCSDKNNNLDCRCLV